MAPGNASLSPHTQRPQQGRLRVKPDLHVITNVKFAMRHRYIQIWICHWVAGQKILPFAGFVPDDNYFKTSPTDHADCFSCHFKGPKPTAEDCDGCHKLSATRNVVWAPRYRICAKFNHAFKIHVGDCVSCHINITKVTATLRELRPDVPISACSECHNREGLSLDIEKELDAIDRNTSFVCSYCHTSNIGRLDPPPSHYLIANRPPIGRKNLK